MIFLSILMRAISIIQLMNCEAVICLEEAAEASHNEQISIDTSRKLLTQFLECVRLVAAFALTATLSLELR